MAGVQANFSEWIVDSGTSRHMSGERGFFEDLEESAEKSDSLVEGRLLCYHDYGKTTTVILGNACSYQVGNHRRWSIGSGRDQD